MPLAMVWLWFQRDSRPKLSSRWYPGLACLVLAHVALCVSQWLHLPSIGRWTVPLWLAGWVGWMAGRETLRWSLPAIGLLAFMIPLPFQCEQLLDHSLQQMSAHASCLWLALLSVPSASDGFTLWLPSGQLVITDDCSGFGMMLALAAVVYVYHAYPATRPQAEQGFRHLRLSVRLVAYVVLIAVIAVLTNASRIAAMGYVMHCYGDRDFTKLVHDLGDWAVLPVAIVLLLGALRWMTQAGPLSDSIVAWLQFPEFVPPWRRLRHQLVRIAVLPLLVVAALGLGAVRHRQVRRHFVATCFQKADNHERLSDWSSASSVYRAMIPFHPDPDCIRLRLASSMSQIAHTGEQQQLVLWQLEDILARRPFDAACLRSHLELALRLDRPASAASSAMKLAQADAFHAKSRQLCLEAALRYPDRLKPLRWENADQLRAQVELAGPVETWRPRLVAELCSEYCRHPESVLPAEIPRLASALKSATRTINTAESYFIAWQFERTFESNAGSNAGSLDAVLKRMDADCPPATAADIYLAAANQISSTQSLQRRRLLENARTAAPNDYRVHASLGQHFVEIGDTRSALSSQLRAWRLSLSQRVALDQRLDLGNQLAKTLLVERQIDGAATIVGQLDELIQQSLAQPSVAQRVGLELVRASLAMAQDEHDRALTVLRRAEVLAARIPNEAASTDARRGTEDLQAQCLIRLRKYSEAARLFERRAAKMQPAADQWTAAARAWRQAGQFANSQDCYRNAVRLAQEPGDLWLEYLSMLRHSRGPHVAADEVQRFSHDMPDGILAQAWEIVGAPTRALAHYESSATEDPKQIAALSIALSRQGDLNRALALISDPASSLESIPRAHTAAMCGVVATEMSDAHVQEIEMILASVANERCNSAELNVAIAQWHTRRGNVRGAMDSLERALSIEPSHPIAANNLAMLLVEQGRDFDRALQSIDRVLADSGGSPEFLDTKGWILLRMNRPDDAIRWLQMAVAKSIASDPVLQLHLAAAYLALGQDEKAKQTLTVAQALEVESTPLHPSEREVLTQLKNRFAETQVKQSLDRAANKEKA